MRKHPQPILRPASPATSGPESSLRGGAGPFRVAVLVLLLLAALLPGSARAQFEAFGKNKVQYTDFRWLVMESRHFQLYYYEEEAGLAAQALEMAEASYLVLRERFATDVLKPIPLIVYSSHQDFEQTNVTPIFLPEGIAGLTEYAKGRVLIPYDGSLNNFRVTIQHELVHVFQLATQERIYREHFKNAPLSPPQWFTEGLAVHWSESRDSEADMVLRDMVVAGRIPSIHDFWRYDGTFTVYKLGQSVLDYIGDTYGEDRIRLFYERLWTATSFEDLIRDVLGVSEEELTTRWSFALRQRYYEDVETAVPASFLSREVTRPGGADFKPLPLPAGACADSDHFAFLSPRTGYTNIYTASMGGEEGKRDRDLKTLVAGERRPEFESFHAFRSRMDVDSAGTLLFVSKHFGRDEIVLYSIPRRQVIESHGFEKLVGLNSPAWIHPEVSFAFSGLSKDGTSDIYSYDLTSGRLTRLTSDRYQDLDPTYLPWDDALVWSSDRAVHGDRGALNLFLLDFHNGEIRALTRGPWKDTAPAADPKSRTILFVSDRDRFHNVYEIDDRGNGKQCTHSLQAIMDPRPIPGEPRYLATVFDHGGFQVRSFPLPDSTGSLIALAPPDTTKPWDWRVVAPKVASRTESYKTHFSLDVAQGGALLGPGMGAGEGMLAAFSDMMGNHLIYLGLGNGTFVGNNILRNLSVAVSYVNLSRRLNYGVTAFHYAGDYFDELGDPFFERRAGAGVLLRYPLSKYERFETNTDLAYSETDRPSVNFRRDGPVASQSLSFIRDTALWLPTGPIDGQRLNLTAGVTMNVNKGKNENAVLLGDWRGYKRVGMYSAYALRAQARWSEGPNPEIFLLGGSYSLRGWPRKAFYGKRTLLLNQELRFPLVRGLVLGLPVGDLELPGIEGALFGDAGSAWNEGWSPRWQGSYGFGFRMGFGGFLVFRLDEGWRTTFHKWSEGNQTEFSIGWDY